MSKYRGLVFEAEVSRDVEPSATVLYDMSRYQNNGAFLAAGEPAWVQLPSGLWVLRFDGINDIVTIPDSPSLNIIGRLSIAAWVKTNANEPGGVVDKNYAVGGFMLWVENWTVLRIYANNILQANSPVMTQQVWHFIVGVFDGVANQLYSDGVAGISLAGDLPTGNASDVTLGVAAATFSNIETALIRIYNYALSAGQVLKHFEAERSLFGV